MKMYLPTEKDWITKVTRKGVKLRHDGMKKSKRPYTRKSSYSKDGINQEIKTATNDTAKKEKELNTLLNNQNKNRGVISANP